MAGITTMLLHMIFYNSMIYSSTHRKPHMELSLIITCATFGLVLANLAIWLFSKNKQGKNIQQLQESLKQLILKFEERDKNFNQIREDLQRFRERFDDQQLQHLKTTQETLQKGIFNVQQHVSQTLNSHIEQLMKQMDKLRDNTSLHLKEISGQVEKRLAEGFDKTTKTFTDVVKRLALIDEAQKKITELSSNVVSLQEVLSDKRSRGAFGEVQLSALIHNMLPEKHYALQHSFSNNCRADAVLFLPEPTSTIAIDAKFPLETYQKLSNPQLSEFDRKVAETQFRLDIKKHINDIAEKYIIPGETSDGAVMFIPAEAVFAEIHAHYPDLVEEAHRKRVWIVSPTTMMAILTTARAVIKDAATRKQVHIIQEHLVALSRDFDRFQKRMDNLSKHIEQAQSDVEDIHKSSRKITNRFAKIEKVELDHQESEILLLEEELSED